MKRVLMLVPVAVLATACVSSGTVTSKSHHEAYSYITFIPISTGNSTSLIPQTNYVPECWELDLQNGDDTGSVCIDPITWRNVAVGEHYSDGEVK